MPPKIAVSRQIEAKFKPFIITFRTMIKYHLAGIIFEINCIGKGRFSKGNIKPLNKIVGIIKPPNARNIATCCDSVMVEINNPKANEQMM